MEREQNPEKVRPLKDNCNRCKKNYRLTMENAYINHYEKKPECSHMMAKCSRCEFITMIFLAADGDTMDRARENLININNIDWPSDSVYNTWLRVMGIELIEPTALTPRQEELVRNIGSFLQHIDVTVADFMPEEGYHV